MRCEVLDDGSDESLKFQRDDRREVVSGSSGAQRGYPGPANRGSPSENAKSRITIRSSSRNGFFGWAGTASSGIVLAASDESAAVALALPESSPWGRNDEAPKAERGRGLDDVREGWDEVLCRLPPLEDDVEEARSRDAEEGEGNPVASSCGEYTWEDGREGAGEGGAGRLDWRLEFERGLIGIGCTKGVPEDDAVIGVPSAAVAENVGAAKLEELMCGGSLETGEGAVTEVVMVGARISSGPWCISGRQTSKGRPSKGVRAVLTFPRCSLFRRERVLRCLWRYTHGCTCFRY